MTTCHIQVLGRNHRHFLAACLRSCLNSTVQAPILYVDNASADQSVEFVRDKFPTVQVLANDLNRGYGGGHNDGLRTIRDTEVVIVLNPDVELEPDFVEKGMAAFTVGSVGAVAPLLFTERTSEERGRGSVIDSFGDVLLPSLRAVNFLAGRTLADLRSPVADLHPWGFTGAAAFLRRRALDDVSLDGEVFDEDLFAYREDVDLSWRLRLRGWEIVGAPGARATHVRAVKKGGPKSPRVAQLSWHNYFLVLVKSVPGFVLILHAVPIAVESIARLLQLLVHPLLWPALPELVRLSPSFLGKRRAVFSLWKRGQEPFSSRRKPGAREKNGS